MAAATYYYLTWSSTSAKLTVEASILRGVHASYLVYRNTTSLGQVPEGDGAWALIVGNLEV